MLILDLEVSCLIVEFDLFDVPSPIGGPEGSSNRGSEGAEVILISQLSFYRFSNADLNYPFPNFNCISQLSFSQFQLYFSTILFRDDPSNHVSTIF